MKRRFVALMFCVALLGAVLVPKAKADSGNQEMILTIKKGPVELPGHVLMPGKYDLEFINMEHNRVLVRTADGSKPIGFFTVIPVTRNRATDSPKVDIAEPAKGSIARMDEFFYPDLKTGYEFIYPHPAVTAQAVAPRS